MRALRVVAREAACSAAAENESYNCHQQAKLGTALCAQEPGQCSTSVTFRKKQTSLKEQKAAVSTTRAGQV